MDLTTYTGQGSYSAREQNSSAGELAGWLAGWLKDSTRADAPGANSDL